MSPIKGLLFDKDGTLVDFQKTWFGIGDHMAMRAAGGDRGRADALMEAAGYDFAERRFRPDSVFAAGTNADIVALWYPDLPAAARQAVMAEYDAFTAVEGAAHAVALPGIHEAVAALHASGLRIGLCTNDSTGGAERTLLALGMAQLFHAIYGYDAVANPKPAPDALFAFCDMSGLKPREIAVIGDNRHDLVMARAGGAGLAIAVLSGTGTRETLGPLANVVLGSVAELPALLDARGKGPTDLMLP